MKKIVYVLIIIPLLFIYFGVFSYFNNVYAENEYPPNVTLAKTETVNNDYFAAGNTVTVSGTVNGDAYVAGGNVTFDGLVNGDLLVAGGNVTILGKVTGDVRAAGGNLIFSSQVDKNTTLLGGSITMSDSGKSLGSLVAAGGNISINSPIGKGATVAGGQVKLGNTIGNSVNAYTGNLVLDSGTKIAGDLNYWSEQEQTLNPEASISGKANYHYVQTPKYAGEKVDKGKILGIAKIGSLLFGLYILIVEFIIGLLIIKLLPVFVVQTTEVINSRPLASLGLGFLVVILFPVVFMFLLISVIGIPLSLVLFVAIILYWIFSGVIVSLFVGLKAQHYFGQQKTSLYWSYLVGLIIMTLVGLIPVINFLVGMAGFLIGTGALLLQKKTVYNLLRQKELI